MFGNPSQKKVKPANVELFQSTLVNEVWLSWLRWVISFCGPPVSESFENENAYAGVCVGLFKPSLQRAQLLVPSGSGPLIWASKKMPNVFNGSLAERTPRVCELSSLFELVGCATVTGTVFNEPAI